MRSIAMSYRKKRPSSLNVYNIFNQLYFKYFEDTFIRKANKVKSERTYRYLESFITNKYSDKFGSLDNLKKYIIWVFQNKGKVPVVTLHCYLDEWENTNEDDIKSFSIEISTYIREDKKLHSWEDYITAKHTFYPPILEHYMNGKKEVPFELILYLDILNSSKKHKKVIKSLFSKEIYNKSEHEKRLDKNKRFIENEIEEIKDMI